MSTDISTSDYLALRNLAFEWSESYDNKDWDRLRNILAPSIRLDFRSLRGELHDGINPDEYVAILSGMQLLGDARLKTQHHLGASKWELLSDGSVKVDHQIRVAHQRYKNTDFTEVVNKGHAHGLTKHVYTKVDGTWKISGVAPDLNWFEYDLFGTLAPPEE